MFIGKIAKDGKGEVKFPLLSDPKHETIDAYGLFDTRYVGKGVEGIPQPAVFVLNEKREIVWANVESDYTKRPSVEEIRTELDKLRNKSKTDNKIMDKKEKSDLKKNQTKIDK
jgi:peroxiredoxin